MDCGDIARKYARRSPDANAVTFEGTTLSAAELLERSFRLANGLEALGLAHQDAVATLGVNSLRSVEEVVGLAIGGFIRVPLHQGNSAAAHRHMLEHSRARVLITDSVGLAECGDALVGLEHLEAIIVDDDTSPLRYSSLLASASSHDPSIRLADDDAIQIGYTGGTTGPSKGAVQTHGRWLDVTIENMGLLPAPDAAIVDRFVAAGPLSGAAGSYTFACLARGIEIIIAPDRTITTATRLVEKHDATILFALPPLVQAVADDPAAGPLNHTRLRSIISAGAPLASRIIRTISAKVGPILTFAYGQSECLPIAALTPDLIARGTASEPELLRSVGRPLTRSIVRIVSPSGDELPVGDVGEITADAAGNLAYYWGNPEATAEKITSDGYVRTGDLGRLRHDGILFLADRSEDIITMRGAAVIPSDLEDNFAEHPAVHEVVVIGRDDIELGQRPEAVVSLTPGSPLSENDIRDWWLARSSGDAALVSVRLSPRPLPRTPAGKLSRRLVRETFTAQPS